MSQKSTLNSLIKSYATVVFSRHDMNAITMDLQNFEIPDINKGTTEVKFRGLTTLKEGDSLTFGEFDLEIIIDEYLENYIFLYDWILSGKEYKSTNVNEQKDMAKILIYRPDGQRKKVRAEVTYHNIKIKHMEKIKFNATNREIKSVLRVIFEAQFIEPRSLKDN
jgi:hypothetical protein